MRSRNILNILVLTATFVIAACTKTEPFQLKESTCDDLLGRAVNFEPYFTNLFESKATSFIDGSFNDYDRLIIYREYWDENKKEFVSGQSYRIYSLGLIANTGWAPASEVTGKEDGAYFTQTKADSLTWDNNETVRFRSVFRSNFWGSISEGNERYYPDFGVSDWVTASGPTLNIPLGIKHLCSRIIISNINRGNQLSSADISVDVADYMRDGVDLETATARAAAVKAVYERLCLPSGVNIDSTRLYAMPKTYYENNSLKDVETEPRSAAHVDFGVLTPDAISSDIQRPDFSAPMSNCLIFTTIPYDMSNASTKGELLVLPPYTRFKVYLYDVNNGDSSQTSGTEGTYHLLDISTIVDDDNNPVFPDGLTFKPGYSYWFRVGYRYNQLFAKTVDNLSWDEQTASLLDGIRETVPLPDSTYVWWQTAMNNAAATAISTNNFNPIFEINDNATFLSFINLVNGTASDKIGVGHDGLYRAWTRYGGGKVTGWYSWQYDGDTTWVRRGKVNEPGYEGFLSEFIFYDHYHPQDGDVKAYVQEDYVYAPYSFYDASLIKHFKITLKNDLDLSDWNLSSIGTADDAFQGYFEGNCHCLNNINTTDGYVFGHIKNAAVRNLYISTVHKTSLVNLASGSNTIVGISMNADSNGPSIAVQLGENEDDKNYVIGCAHYGLSTNGLVGTNVGNLQMYGCLQTSPNLTGGALCGVDQTNSLAPQKGKVVWGNFIGNYYDKLVSPSAKAVGTVPDAYAAQEYIRGVSSHIIKARYDLSVPGNRTSSSLTSQEKNEFYGIAPWRAMNSAIHKFNNSEAGKLHHCIMHYETGGSTGYNNYYPKFVNGAPTEFVDLVTEPN